MFEIFRVPKPAPFAEGPVRHKQVISLGFYRTGSQSLKEALSILGYRDVFHTSAMSTSLDKWAGLEIVADNNIPCLPSYTGCTWTRADFDTYFGPCEALTDVTPFAEPLLNAYPEARVILVHRDFDSWVQSFQNTLVLPSSKGPLAWLSGNVFEPILGIRLSQTAWKMYIGLLGVCDLRKTRDRRVMKAGYDRHYAAVRRIVPPERLLEFDLKDLDWKPLCEFLDKEVPDVPFPRLNESRVFRDEFGRLHRMTLIGGLIKILLPFMLTGGVVAVGILVARMSSARQGA